MTLDDDDRRRERVGCFHEQPIWTEDGLILGVGTRLLPLGKGAVAPDVGARMLAILSVAYGRAIPDDVLGRVEASQAQRARGEPALAQIYLALAQLPRIDKAGAYRAFLAEHALDGGMAPEALRATLGLSIPDVSRKFVASQPRVPSGSGRASGRWTSGNGGDAAQNSADVRSLFHTIASADDRQGLKKARAAANAAGGLNDDGLTKFHDEITGQGITDFWELVRIAKEIKEKR